MVQSRRGTFRLNIRTALYLGVGLLTVLITALAVEHYRASREDYRRAARATAIVNVVKDLTGVAHDWAVERGLVFAALHDPAPVTADRLETIRKHAAQGDRALAAAKAHLAEHRIGLGRGDPLGMLVTIRESVAELRQKVRTSLHKPREARAKGLAATWMRSMTQAIVRAQGLAGGLIGQGAVGHAIQDELLASQAAATASEYLGRERALLAGLVETRRPARRSEIHRLGVSDGRIKAALQIVESLRLSGSLPLEVEASMDEAAGALNGDFRDLRRDIRAAALTDGDYPVHPEAWFTAATDSIDAVFAFQSTAIDAAAAHVRTVRDTTGDHLRIDVAMIAAALGLGLFCLLFIGGRVVRPLRTITDSLRAIAAGREDLSLPASGRSDEIGALTQAIHAFRVATEERRRLEAEVKTRREVEQDLRQAKYRAETANAAKSQFLANVSHELRTPLNAVIGFAELLHSELKGPLNDAQKSYVRDIQTSGEHLLALINDILELAKTESGKLVANRSDVAPEDVVKRAIRQVSHRAEERAVHLETDVSRAPVSIQADERMLLQILLNLLTNAVKFTSSGGTIRVVVETAGDANVKFIVSDTGCGMDPAEVAQALEVFAQVDNQPRNISEGTGLGLPLVKRLAELHEGTLAVESARGRGTTATVELPMGASDRPAQDNSGCAAA